MDDRLSPLGDHCRYVASHMGLDIYVMPLSHFLAGEFSSPIQTTLSVGNDSTKPLAARMASKFRIWRCAAAVRKMMRNASKKATRSIRWNDDGQTIFAEQGARMFEFKMRVLELDYGDMLDWRCGQPRRYPDLNDFQSIRPARFFNIIQFDFFWDIFVPIEFDGWIEFAAAKTHGQRIFSSISLLDQLIELKAELSWDPDTWNAQQTDDPNCHHKWSFKQLETVANLSCANQLPIIFDG